MTTTPTPAPRIAPPLMESIGDAELRAAVGELPDDALADACSYLVTGRGKRLRPAICLEAAKFGPSGMTANARQAAAALELFHVATLAQDDMIDDSPERRGRPSLFGRSGAGVAGLTASWLLARAAALVVDSGPVAVTCFADASAQICQGQMLEVEDLFNLDRTPERYFDAIRGKTASLFWLSACLGAIAAEADEPTTYALAAFGFNLGMVFQLTDDVLDIVGDSDVLGKQPGTDIRQGVYTLPVIHALASDPSLRELLEGDDLGEDVAEACAIVANGAGIDETVGLAHDHAVNARRSLSAIPRPDSEGLHRLLGVLEFCIGRIDR